MNAASGSTATNSAPGATADLLINRRTAYIGRIGTGDSG
jgi:hypothetical protein